MSIVEAGVLGARYLEIACQADFCQRHWWRDIEAAAAMFGPAVTLGEVEETCGWCAAGRSRVRRVIGGRSSAPNPQA